MLFQNMMNVLNPKQREKYKYEVSKFNDKTIFKNLILYLYNTLLILFFICLYDIYTEKNVLMLKTCSESSKKNNILEEGNIQITE